MRVEIKRGYQRKSDRIVRENRTISAVTATIGMIRTRVRENQTELCVRENQTALCVRENRTISALMAMIETIRTRVRSVDLPVSAKIKSYPNCIGYIDISRG